MRLFAVFVLGRHLPPPQIGISPGGFAHAVWRVPDGILAMNFLPSGKVRFTATLQDSGWNANGMLPPDSMMGEIEPFKTALGR